MTRISDTFAALRARGEVALIPYITAGDPDLDTTFQLVHELTRQGADLIELGIPFSDPMADGPTNQRAAERALRSGTSLARVLDLVQNVRRSLSIPLILFTYYNPVFRYGGERFARDARQAGVDGVICVDLPPEEADELKRETDRQDLDLIFLLAPTSSLSRAQTVLTRVRGFVYYVAVTGVTGARTTLPPDLGEMVRRIRAISPVPVGVGFGISSPAQAAQVAGVADAVIVGSAISQIIETHCGQSDLVVRVGEFVGSLKQGLRERALRVSPPSETALAKS
ncbi:MAG: tryptophan synthase subunit alpha [Deltaproteobacteria bacterium]|nr:tryptophan synthase subunit alpha [Deltaproteobacteria bacterium]